jgi:hypothetical protein
MPDAATRKEASQRNTGGNMLIDIAPPAPSAPAIRPSHPNRPRRLLPAMCRQSPCTASTQGGTETR